MLKIFLMTKNDVGFIENWILYHGYHFGLENLHLLDGSDDERVLAIYDFYKKHGLNVHHTATGLNGLADELTALMARHADGDHFLIKMDSDEFLAYAEPPLLQRAAVNSAAAALRLMRQKRRKLLGKSASQKVRDYDWVVPDEARLRADRFTEFLRALPKTPCAYKAGLTVNSIPATGHVTDAPLEVTRFAKMECTDFKSFFHASGFVSIDLGGHGGEAKDKSRVIFTGLTVFHYHFTSVADFVARAKKVLVSHEFIADADELEVQKAKLEALMAAGMTTSSHKIRFYLDYLRCAGDPAAIERLAASYFHPFGGATKETVEINLIRDTLVMIRSRSDFPVRSEVATHGA